MLPKNVLRDRRLERLRIFEGEDIGTLAGNIVKRFEDGTLPPAQPVLPSSHIHGRSKAEHKMAKKKRWEEAAARVKESASPASQPQAAS